MFEDNKFDEIKRFQKGMTGNPTENSPGGFKERMKHGPITRDKLEKAVNDLGPYQDITKNTPGSFKQNLEYLDDKSQEDIKPYVPEPIIDLNKINKDSLPKYEPPKYVPPKFDLGDSLKPKKPWEKY